MITVFAYWFGLLWNVPLDKEKFAGLSIMEFGTELLVLIVLVFPEILSMILLRKGEKK